MRNSSFTVDVLGRANEVSRITDALGSMTTDGVALVLEGEAGIGKTFLVSAFSQAALGRGYRLLQCEGRPGNAEPAFTGLRRLLQPALGLIETLPEGQRLALTAALQGADPTDLLLVCLGARALLKEFAAQGPVLLVAEDGQWLDRLSLQVICFLARRLSDLPLALIVTARPQGQPAPLQALAVERIPLGPMDEDDVRRLLERDGCLPATDLGHRVLAVLAEARGNPLAALALAGAHGGDRPEGVVGAAQPPIGDFVAQIAALPASSRRLLLLAVAGDGMPLSDLANAAQRAGLGIEDWAPLERTGWVSVTSEQVRIEHPALRPAVYAVATSAERAATHTLLADVTADPGTAAVHQAAASSGRSEAQAAALELAAARARAGGAPAEASAAFSRAAALWPSPRRRMRRLVGAAESARAAGLAGQAAALVNEAFGLPGDPEVVVALARVQLMLNITTCTHDRSTADFEQLSARLADAGSSASPDERVGLLWCAAVNCRARGLPPEEFTRIAEHLDAIDSTSPLKTLALAILAPPQQAALLRDRLPPLMSRLAHDPLAVLSLALAAESVLDLRTARTCLDLSADLFRQSQSPADECQALRGRASLRLAAGELAGGLHDAEQAERLAATAGATVIARMSAALVARAQVWLGEYGVARSALERTNHPDGGEVTAVTAGARWAAGLLALAEGRHEPAWNELDQARRDPAQALWVIADLTEAAVVTGREADAEALVQALARIPVVTDSAVLTMLLERSRALLHHREQAAEEHYERSVQAGLRAAAPLELARTRLWFGRWLRRQKRLEEAREQLTEAWQSFDRAGARPWAGQALTELRAAGLSVVTSGHSVNPVSPAGAVVPQLRRELTSRELHIAELAASGKTNKEIAANLHVSPRTVGTTLYRLFPKLGISRRSQLHDVLRRPVG